MRQFVTLAALISFLGLTGLGGFGLWLSAIHPAEIDGVADHKSVEAWIDVGIERARLEQMHFEYVLFNMSDDEYESQKSRLLEKEQKILWHYPASVEAMEAYQERRTEHSSWWPVLKASILLLIASLAWLHGAAWEADTSARVNRNAPAAQKN